MKALGYRRYQSLLECILRIRFLHVCVKVSSLKLAKFTIFFPLNQIFSKHKINTKKKRTKERNQ